MYLTSKNISLRNIQTTSSKKNFNLVKFSIFCDFLNCGKFRQKRRHFGSSPSEANLVPRVLSLPQKGNPGDEVADADINRSGLAHPRSLPYSDLNKNLDDLKKFTENRGFNQIKKLFPISVLDNAKIYLRQKNF